MLHRAGYVAVTRSRVRPRRVRSARRARTMAGTGALIISNYEIISRAAHVVTSDAHPTVVTYLKANLWLNGAWVGAPPDDVVAVQTSHRA